MKKAIILFFSFLCDSVCFQLGRLIVLVFYLPLYCLTAKWPIFYKSKKFLLALSCCQSECSFYSALCVRHLLKFCGYLKANLSQWRKEVFWVRLVPVFTGIYNFYNFNCNLYTYYKNTKKMPSKYILKRYLNEILRTWESQQTFSIAFLPCWTW